MFAAYLLLVAYTMLFLERQRLGTWHRSQCCWLLKECPNPTSRASAACTEPLDFLLAVGSLLK